MLKRFFISMLGTIAGIWIAVVLVVIGGFMLVVSLGSKSADSAIKVESESILYFDLSGDIQDRYTKQPFIQMVQNLNRGGQTLDDMLRALPLAAEDDKIEGLYIDCGGASLGLAGREELIQAINAFKESGKWVAAYSDAYAQSDYLVATTADSIFLNPIGVVDIHGVGGMTPFFKGLLDKLGVKMQIIKVGTFKSAVEPYILTSMSEPARLQMQQYCDSLWSYVAGTIACNRGLSEDSIYAMASQMIFTHQAESYVSAGLVDGLKYRREVDDYLRGLTGLGSDKDLRLVTPADYLASKGNPSYSSGKKHVAVYYAVGDIVDSGSEGIVGSVVPGEIIKLADNDDVAGMVLRVNSPGGSAFASEQIWEALDYFKGKGKPLYVSMGDYAASGGYYISCGADTIFADATTLTGSIGVFGMIPDLSGLVSDKFGVTFSTVQTNPNAVGVTTMQAMTPAQHAAMQRNVENVYELFTKRVAEGRHMAQDSVKAIAEGRVWVGSRAVQLGLVDYIGTLEDAVVALTDQLGLDSDAYVAYPRYEQKFWERIILESGGIDALQADPAFDAETMQNLQYIKRLRDMNPIQARMEEVIIR